MDEAHRARRLPRSTPLPEDAAASGCGNQRFAVNCPSRLLIDQIADKWSMMVLVVLDGGSVRFNAIKRQLEGVTQKALTQTLRRLERNGLIERRVAATGPLAVTYAITLLGRTLQAPFRALYAWTLDHLDEVEVARGRFDQRANAA